MNGVNIHEAKTTFSKLIEKVKSGEEIIITKAGEPVAKLVPILNKGKKNRVPGKWKGKIFISDDFNDPLPEEILNEFYK